jgi:hypothetical protein
MDYVITTATAVIVMLRSGRDTPYGSPPSAAIVKGTGISNEQCVWLRTTLAGSSGKRKIIIMHHPAVNVAGTNSDGTPFAGIIADPSQNSLLNNRTTFLNICDSNKVDIVLCGHAHQNVVANRKGEVILENRPDSTRFVQTGGAFNRSYRTITVDPAFVTVGPPLRSPPATAVDREEAITALTPTLCTLSQNYPNPFNPSTTIRYGLPARSHVSLTVFNTLGQHVSTLMNGEQEAGYHEVQFNATNLSSGVYFYRLQASEYVQTKRLLLLR